MENIVKLPKENIISVYDLKGSTYNRKILKNKKKSIIPVNKVLYDLDFLEQEK